MNLSTKIYKFKKAVWEYRGRYSVQTGKWIKPPSKKAKSRVEKGFERLGIHPTVGMIKVKTFRNGGEFEKWLIEIRKEQELKK